ncbi:MAG: enoyl-CoA hydratase/isomerase family protein [Microbacteriaceae bacterium]|nr:enoyl-CoA hydratase/isomerase family protein [Microbacteriaceae bacterium]
MDTVKEPVEVDFEVAGDVLLVTLQRPRQLNALNTAMCRVITAQIKNLPAGTRAIIIRGAGEKGLCGGGDIKAMRTPELGTEFLRAEYEMDLAVHTAPVPVISFMTGITMGGGVGISGHASVRVVDETSRIAMPETRIGIVPDVGANRILAKAPAPFGEVVAVTSCEFGAGDAIAAGFADYFVLKEKHEVLVENIIAGAEPAAAVAELATAPPAAALVEALKPLAADIAALDPLNAPADALSALQRLLAAVPQAATAVARLSEVSPFAAAVAWNQVRRWQGKNPSLAEVLADDLRVVGELVAHPNFLEGVRARLIDKDNSPQWQPATFPEITPADVAELVSP